MSSPSSAFLALAAFLATKQISMKHGTYDGSEPSLRGMTAIYTPRVGEPGKVDAQFDGGDWRRQAYADEQPRHPETGAVLTLGWHKFDEADFVEDPKVDNG